MPKDLITHLPASAKSAREKILNLQAVFMKAKYKEVKITLKEDLVTIKAKRQNGDNVFERIYGDENFSKKKLYVVTDSMLSSDASM